MIVTLVSRTTPAIDIASMSSLVLMLSQPESRPFPVMSDIPSGRMEPSLQAAAAAARQSPTQLLGRIQELFDVSTDDIVDRVKFSATGFKLAVSPITASAALSERPDMYGPFWITTSAILAMASCSGYSSMWIAAVLLYGILIGIPVALWVYSKFQPSSAEPITVPYTPIICVYGYSNLSIIIVAVFCHFPIPIFQKAVACIGAVNSGIFLYRNFWNSIDQRSRIVVIFLTLGCQAMTYLTFYAIFL